MSRLPYHRHFHDDALTGMRDLTLEERGAYYTILDMIYAKGAAIDDDPRRIAAELIVSRQRWTGIRARLIRLGKLWADRGLLGNARADDELANQFKALQKMSTAGARGGRASARNRHGTPKTTQQSAERNGEHTSANRQAKSDLSSQDPRDASDEGKGTLEGTLKGGLKGACSIQNPLEDSLSTVVDKPPARDRETSSPAPVGPPSPLIGGGPMGAANRRKTISAPPPQRSLDEQIADLTAAAAVESAAVIPITEARKAAP